MSDQTGVRAFISWVVDKTGLSAAITGLENITKSGKKLKNEFFSLNKIVRDAIKSFGAMFALQSVFSFIKTAVVDFAKLDRALSTTRIRMGALGMDVSKDLPKVREYLQALQDAGGPLINETIPAFSKFIGITKDVGAALAATKLAADISEGASIDLATASGYVADIMQGKAKGAAQALGIELYTLDGRLRTNAEILDEVFKLWNGLSDRTNDAQDSLDKLGNQWEKFKTQLGETLAPLTAVLVKIGEMQAAFQSLMRTIGESASQKLFGTKNIMSWFDNLDTVTPAPLGGGPLTPEQQKLRDQTARKDAEQAREALFQRMEDESKANKKELEDAKRQIKEKADIVSRQREEELQAEIQLQSAIVDAAEAGTSERLAAELNLLKLQEQAALQGENLTEAARETIRDTFAQQRLNKTTTYFEAEADAMMEAYAKGLEGAKAYDEEWQALTARERDARVEEIDEHLARVQEAGIWVKDFEIQLALEEIEIKRQMQIEELNEQMQREIEATQATGAQKLAIERYYQKQMVKTTKKAETDKDKLNQWASMNTIERVRYVASVVQSINMAVFGNNKNIATAAAIVETIGAAIEAFHRAGGYPAGLAPMAISLAMGYAKVKQIRNTNPEKGKGFDNPVHDRIAETGGQRWSRDMVMNWERGVARGWANGFSEMARGSSSSSSTISYDQRSTQHIHYHGTVIDEERAARRLHRVLVRVGRRDDRSRYIA